MCRRLLICVLVAFMEGMISPLSAQDILHRVDSLLITNYNRTKYDTAYVVRPHAKWTITARLNVSGATIETEGIDQGQHFKSQMEAKPLSVWVSAIVVLRSAYH